MFAKQYTETEFTQSAPAHFRFPCLANFDTICIVMKQNYPKVWSCLMACN